MSGAGRGLKPGAVDYFKTLAPHHLLNIKNIIDSAAGKGRSPQRPCEVGGMWDDPRLTYEEMWRGENI